MCNKLKTLSLINKNIKNDKWIEILTKPPYNLIIKQDDIYYILKYNQISSDMSNDIVKESRGLIIKKENKKFKAVCIPFFKFFCLGDPNSKKDRYKLSHRKELFITEKIDGSLIKIWFDNGKWHISTNGTIDANKAITNDILGKEYSFLDIFNSANNNLIDFDRLDKNYTYMFELVSPINKIVVSYNKAELFYLGRRNNLTLKETNYIEDKCEGLENISRPKIYKIEANRYKNKKQLWKAINQMNNKISIENSVHYEGFVVTDYSLKSKIKMKSSIYLDLFVKRGNGIIKNKKILLMIVNHKDDDFLSYFPEFKDKFDNIRKKLNKFILDIGEDMEYIKNGKDNNIWETKKDFALWAKNSTVPTISFKAYSEDYINYDWIEEQVNHIHIDKLIEILKLEN